MAVYRTTFREFAPTLRKLAKAQVKAGITAMQITSDRGIQFVHDEIAKTVPSPVDMGTYRWSWKSQDLPRGAMIFNTQLYASVIEGGRRPGARMPPAAVLGEWARRKGLLRDVPKGDMNAAMRSIGFALARSIARKGIPAKNVLGRVVERLVPEMRKAIVAAMNAAVP